MTRDQIRARAGVLAEQIAEQTLIARQLIGISGECLLTDFDKSTAHRALASQILDIETSPLAAELASLVVNFRSAFPGEA